MAAVSTAGQLACIRSECTKIPQKNITNISQGIYAISRDVGGPDEFTNETDNG